MSIKVNIPNLSLFFFLDLDLENVMLMMRAWKDIYLFIYKQLLLHIKLIYRIITLSFSCNHDQYHLTAI